MASHGGNNMDSFIENLQFAINQLNETENNREKTDVFSMDAYWERLGGAVKALSAESTKLCMVCSKPPMPSASELEPIIQSMERITLAMVSAFYALPRTQGQTLTHCIKQTLVSIIESVQKLVEVIRDTGSQSSPLQLQRTGGVWAYCDAFTGLPQDNKQACIQRGGELLGLVKDACDELKEAQDQEEMEVDDEDEEEPKWAPADRKILVPVTGLVSASRACTSKVLKAIRKNGNCDDDTTIAQLDSILVKLELVSPLVDEFLLAVYPPLDRHLVIQQADHLAATLHDLLALAKNIHITTEEDQTWLEFMDNAVEHNLTNLHTALDNPS